MINHYVMGILFTNEGDTLLQMNIPTFVGGLSGTTHINLTNNGYSGPDYSGLYNI